MKQYFNKDLINKAKKHASEVFPEESCGFFVGNEYIKMNNLAENKKTDFVIDTKEYIKYDKDIQCIIHSHNNYKHASRKDMEQQIATARPWGIINVVNGSPKDVIFWGDQLERQDFLGRPFHHGVYDCYSLVRDYYKVEKKIELREILRECFHWTEDSMLDNLYSGLGFEKISREEVVPGDGIFFSMSSKWTDHCGILLDKGLVLHHCFNRLSTREPLVSYNKYISGYLRYKKC